MKNIEELLKQSASEAVKNTPPLQFSNTIKNTLKNEKKNNWRFDIKKLISIAATNIVIFVAGVSVYASLGGTIFGKPIFEWMHLKFPDEYQDFIITEEQSLKRGETQIDLVSKVCDDGIIVLEFNLTLSEEDREYINNALIENGGIIQAKGKPKLVFNDKLISSGDNIISQGLNNYNLIIDDKNYWIRPRSSQSVTQITESEYKIYQMYFLTEKELEGKTNFTIELRNVAINTGWGAICIPMNGDFKIHLSKDKALESTQTIMPNCSPVKFKQMTKTVDKVVLTPLQTVVKVTSIIDNVSSINISNTRDENYIGLDEYKAINQNATELSCLAYETRRTIIYENGKTEEWETGDIGTSKEFKNAKMILTEYIIIEKNTETEKIEITPIIRQPQSNGTEERINLNKFIFSLK